MCEHQLVLHGSGTNASIKALDTALYYILQCRQALVALIDKVSTKKNVKEKEIESGNTIEDVTNNKEKLVVEKRVDEKKTKGNDSEMGSTSLKKSQENDVISKESSRGDEEKSDEHSLKGLRKKEQEDASLETEQKTEEKDEIKMVIKERSNDEESNETNLPHKLKLNEEQTIHNYTEDEQKTEKVRKYTDELAQVESTIVKFDERFCQELEVLIPILETRLTFVLKEMVRLRSARKIANKNKELNAVEFEKVKRMYSLALRGFAGNEQEDIFNKVKRIADVLLQIDETKLMT